MDGEGRAPTKQIAFFSLRFSQVIFSNFFHARFLPSKSLNVGHRRSRISKQWTEGIRKVKVWVDSLQFRVQQEQFGPQFVPCIFWVGGYLAPRQHRQDSRRKGRIDVNFNFNFSIVKCCNAKAAEL